MNERSDNSINILKSYRLDIYNNLDNFEHSKISQTHEKFFDL